MGSYELLEVIYFSTNLWSHTTPSWRAWFVSQVYTVPDNVTCDLMSHLFYVSPHLRLLCFCQFRIIELILGLHPTLAPRWFLFYPIDYQDAVAHRNSKPILRNIEERQREI